MLSDSVSSGIAALNGVVCTPPAASLHKMDQLFHYLNDSSIEQSDDKKVRYAVHNSANQKESLESAVQWSVQWKFTMIGNFLLSGSGESQFVQYLHFGKHFMKISILSTC